ncbi:MAG: short-chain dehydrogenase Adh 1 [Ilumatobacteraceae bacterium]|nr:short-chain dehydrogenase Adh 1 [Ilumatobacteraceae bacterium]
MLVTGASSGIGAATAIELARLGAVVALVARREAALGEVLAQCREHSPASAMFVADLSDLDAIPALAELVSSTFGAIDVLVNNAGVPKRRKVEAMSLDDAESVMRINYFSPVALTIALLPSMIERGSGHVVNVSSMGAHMVAFGVGAYSATKAALEMFTESMFVELAGSGIHAHVVVPGTTRSEFSTPKDGNDPPFPSDPATTATAETVAAAIIASLSDDGFITYATERDAGTAAAKHADPNAFLTSMRRRLSGTR